MLRVLHCVDAALLPGELLTLPAPGGSVGRAPDAELPLVSGTVSRLHGRLSVQDGGWWLEALTDTNGSFLDGQPLRTGTAVRLPVGSRIQLGGVVLEVMAHGSEETRPVLTPLEGSAEVLLQARWDGDLCTIRCAGRMLSLEPQPARALAVLMASAGETVHRWDILDRIGAGASLDRCISKVRQGLREAMADGVLSRALVEAGVAAHDADPGPLDALSDGELLRRFLTSHRSHGYRLCLSPAQVQIEEV